MSDPVEAEDRSFASYLEVVRPDVSPALIGPEAMAAIGEVARLFPGSLALRNFGFECNLSRPEPAADFLLLLQARFGRGVLAGSLAPKLRDHPVWRRVSRFLEVWGDPESPLYSTVDNVWLEFDVSTGEHHPVPSVFHGYRLPEKDPGGRSIGQRVEATREAFEVLTGHAIDPAVLGRVQSCFDLLPPGGYEFQLGAMTARETDAFRVCVRLPELSQTAPYLDRLGWTGERDRLTDLLGELHGRITHMCIDLDVAESVRPKIGLECYVEADGTPQRERWAPFLEFLVQSGIALAPKCQALLSYPGHADIRRDGERWPADLRRASDLLGPSAVSVFLRGIHHVKLTLEPGRPIQAKAYLSVRHLWVTPDGSARSA